MSDEDRRESTGRRLTRLARRSDLWIRAHPVRAMLCLSLAIVLVFALSIRPYWNFSFDGHMYAGFARNLAHGEGFQMYGTSFRWQPPLLSIFWVPAYWLPGDPAVNVQLLQLLALLGAAWGTWAWVRRLAGETRAVVVAGLVTLNEALIQTGVGFLSECLFTLWVVLALHAATHLVEGSSVRWRWVLWAGFCASMAALTRNIGLLLVPALAGALIFGVRSRNAGWLAKLAAIAVIGLIGAAPHQAWSRWNRTQPRVTLPSYPTMPDNFRDLLGGQGARTKPLVTHWPQRLAKFAPPQLDLLAASMTHAADDLQPPHGQALWWGSAITLPWAALVLAGWAIQMIRRRGAGEWFFLAYFGVLSIWPDVGIRFLLPLTPITWLYVTVSVGKLFDRLPRPRAAGWVAATLFLVLAVVFSARRGVKLNLRYRTVAEASPSLRRTGEYLATRDDLQAREIGLWLQKGTIAHLLRYHADRPLICLGGEEGPAEYLRQAEQRGRELVVLDFGTRDPGEHTQEIPPALQDRWRIVRTDGVLLVCERKEGKAGDRPAVPSGDAVSSSGLGPGENEAKPTDPR